MTNSNIFKNDDTADNYYLLRQCVFVLQKVVYETVV